MKRSKFRPSTETKRAIRSLQPYWSGEGGLPLHEFGDFLGSSMPLEAPLHSSLDEKRYGELINRLIKIVSNEDGDEAYPFERAAALYELFVASIWSEDTDDRERDKQNALMRAFAPYVFGGLVNFHCESDRRWPFGAERLARFNEHYLEPKGGLRKLAIVPSADDFYASVYSRFNQLRTSLDVLRYLIKAAHIFPEFATREIAINVVADNIFNRRDGYGTTGAKKEIKANQEDKKRGEARKRRMEYLKKEGFAHREINVSAETVRRDWVRAPATLPLIYTLLDLQPSLLDSLTNKYRFRYFILSSIAAAEFSQIGGHVGHAPEIIRRANPQLLVRAAELKIPTLRRGAFFDGTVFTEREFDFLTLYLTRILKKKLTPEDIAQAKNRNSKGMSWLWWGDSLQFDALKIEFE